MNPSPRLSIAAVAEYSDLRATDFQNYAATPAPTAPPAPVEGGELPAYWGGVIGMEKVLTGDGRVIEDGALEWSTPIPFRYVKEDVGGHQGAVVAGRILSISRGEGGAIEAHGDFDLGSSEGREAARLVRDGMMIGVSMDLDSVAFEVRIAEEIIAETDAFFEALEKGEEPEADRTTDEEGRVTVHKMNADDEVMVTTAARVRAATLVSIPAFAEAVVGPLAELPVSDDAEALVASAAPIEPPAAWFNRAEPDAPTALTITDEGQVYGHLATWDVCHIADPNGAGVCVMAPKNHSDYAYFHTGAVKTAEGSLVPTGTLRFETGHASMRSSAEAASAHYDNTGLAGADIHAVDGKHGIWVTGALRPGVSPEQVRTLRASPLSGDWRAINGAFELVGALAVNLPGFPIPRTQGLVASGELQGLVAAGMVAPERAVVDRAASGTALSSRDADYLTRMIDRERTREQRELAARVKTAKDRRNVLALAAKRRSLVSAASAATATTKSI